MAAATRKAANSIAVVAFAVVAFAEGATIAGVRGPAQASIPATSTDGVGQTQATYVADFALSGPGARASAVAVAVSSRRARVIGVASPGRTGEAIATAELLPVPPFASHC